MQLPGIIETAFDDDSPIKSELNFERAPDVVLDSTNTDSGNTPTWRFRAGGVVAYKASSKTWVEADDGTRDADLPPSVSAVEAADADWASDTITITVDDGPGMPVVLSGTDDTNAEVVAAINLQAQGVIADISGGFVRIRTIEPGAHKTLKVTCTLATAFGANDGVTAQGSTVEYRVTLEPGDLKDGAGAAAKASVQACRSGHFKSTLLRNLTKEAKAGLIRQGSIFD